MSKLIAIGEALIDFIPSKTGRLKEVPSFTRCPGGAPANVAAAVAKLGAESMLITKLGADGFGDFLADEIQAAGIDCRGVLRTAEAKTGLAFVSHSEDMDSEYLFYRGPSADMLLAPEDVCESWFEAGDILHFCSVSLLDAPCRRAHDRAIEIAREKGCLISFDVNLRPPLWDDLDELKRVVHRYAPKADIVKAGADELVFLGGVEAPHLLTTKGKDGAEYLGGGLHVCADGFDAPLVDTTGAGDTFMGAFLAHCVRGEMDWAANETVCAEILRFCNATAAIVVGRAGALGAMPTQAEVLTFLAKYDRPSK